MKITRNDNGLTIWVTELPGRKKPVLMISTEHGLHQVASFTSKETAEEFKVFAEKFIRNL